MKKVSVIVVNFNTKEILQKCLQNLFDIKKAYKELEVIVVDNASSDGSFEMVEASFPEVKLVKLPTNQGLATGSNRGLEKADGDYILYLGSDAFPSLETVKGMVDYMEANPNVGISTPKLVLRNGKTDMDAHRGFPTPWAAITHFSKTNRFFPKSKLFNRYFLGHMDLNTPHEIDLCISHFMLIRKKVFDDIGVWDENFFVFGEDVDFCFRAKQAMWKIMYLPQFSAGHYKGVSVGTRKETADITKASIETKILMRKKTTEAMKYFYKKHYSKAYPFFVTWMVLFAIEVMTKTRIFLFKLKNKKEIKKDKVKV